MYFAGLATNLSWQPDEQKKCDLWCCSRRCAAVAGSTVMPQTGSFTPIARIAGRLLSMSPARSATSGSVCQFMVGFRKELLLKAGVASSTLNVASARGRGQKNSGRRGRRRPPQFELRAGGIDARRCEMIKSNSDAVQREGSKSNYRDDAGRLDRLKSASQNIL